MLIILLIDSLYFIEILLLNFDFLRFPIRGTEWSLVDHNLINVFVIIKLTSSPSRLVWTHIGIEAI